jgi:hypothetical protein
MKTNEYIYIIIYIISYYIYIFWEDHVNKLRSLIQWNTNGNISWDMKTNIRQL